MKERKGSLFLCTTRGSYGGLITNNQPPSDLLVPEEIFQVLLPALITLHPSTIHQDLYDCHLGERDLEFVTDLSDRGRQESCPPRGLTNIRLRIGEIEVVQDDVNNVMREDVVIGCG